MAIQYYIHVFGRHGFWLVVIFGSHLTRPISLFSRGRNQAEFLHRERVQLSLRLQATLCIQSLVYDAENRMLNNNNNEKNSFEMALDEKGPRTHTYALHTNSSKYPESKLINFPSFLIYSFNFSCKLRFTVLRLLLASCASLPSVDFGLVAVDA